MAHTHHKVLTNAFSRDHLMEHGMPNGVKWEESNHEGVNWMRFSNSLNRHLQDGNDFHTDGADAQQLQQMHKQYTNLKESHKQSMIPHVRGAMKKLKMDDQSDTSKHHTEYLQDAYKHLDANGGHQWAEKVQTLNHINGKLKDIGGRLQNMGIDVK